MGRPFNERTCCRGNEEGEETGCCSRSEGPKVGRSFYKRTSCWRNEISQVCKTVKAGRQRFQMGGSFNEGACCRRTEVGQKWRKAGQARNQRPKMGGPCNEGASRRGGQIGQNGKTRRARSERFPVGRSSHQRAGCWRGESIQAICQTRSGGFKMGKPCHEGTSCW